MAVSGAFLAAQIAEADRIAAALSASNSKVAAATRAMDVLSDKSNALLESLVAARETERAATDEANSARADLVVLEGRLATARQILRDWVFSVYSGGGGDADIAGMLDAMSSEPDAVGDPLGDLSYLTEQRSRALQDVKVLTAEQVRLSAAADAAEASAATATHVIQRDKAALDKAMLEQRSKVGALRSLQIAEVEKAGPVASVLVGARTPAARAAAQRLRDALLSASVDTMAIGKPCTNDSAVYPNGMIPASGLCPIWGAAGREPLPRCRRQLQRDEQGLCRPDRRAAVHHRLLPLAARPDLDQGQARPLRRHPRHEPPRPGPCGRPVRRRPGLRLTGAPVDAPERPALRLVPPVVGRRGRVASRAVALGVRGLTQPPPTRSRTE